MKDLKNALTEEFWQSFSLEEEDIEFLYNFFLENEKPAKKELLVTEIIQHKIASERKRLETLQSKSALYMPKDSFEIGTTLSFSALKMKTGTITAIREGYNPDTPSFKVIQVEFDNGDIREFASALENHVLNEPILFDPNDPNFDIDFVLTNYRIPITSGLEKSLADNGSFSSIADEWFPESLLIEVNEGHLNLAEAVLDFSSGEPVSTSFICEQTGLTDDNQALIEFSLNIAMQADPRFDEVGPAGEVLWFLTALEPTEVNEQPKTLLSVTPQEFLGSADALENSVQINLFEGVIADEYEIREIETNEVDKLTFSLIYPHWREGTLPLSDELRTFFPTAINSPHIRFTFIDGHTKNTFPGWVVRQHNYVCGLKDWYQKLELLPGSLVHISKGKKPGEVIIRADKKRPSRQWIRVAKVNSNDKLVFSMDMAVVKTGYNDRMILMIDDPDKLDNLWLSTVTAHKFEETLKYIMRELVKLNPQGHVHAQELYAATNLILRTPPRAILSVLNNADWVSHEGDLYYRLADSNQEEANNDG